MKKAFKLLKSFGNWWGSSEEVTCCNAKAKPKRKYKKRKKK